MWTRKGNVLRVHGVYYNITIDTDDMGFGGLSGSKTGSTEGLKNCTKM